MARGPLGYTDELLEECGMLWNWCVADGQNGGWRDSLIVPGCGYLRRDDRLGVRNGLARRRRCGRRSARRGVLCVGRNRHIFHAGIAVRRRGYSGRAQQRRALWSAANLPWRSASGQTPSRREGGWARSARPSSRPHLALWGTLVGSYRWALAGRGHPRVRQPQRGLRSEVEAGWCRWVKVMPRR